MKISKPETLDQALKLFRHKRVQLCIGSRGGYMFIGTAEEFDRDVELLDTHYRAHYFLSDPPWKPLRRRAVKKWYKRKMPMEPMPQIAIIVEGGESGEVVCWQEYARSLPGYYTEYLQIKAGQNNLNGPVPDAWKWENVPEKTKNQVTPYDENWQLLFNAIIVNATDEYRKLYKRRRMRGDHSVDGELEMIEDFLSAGYLMSKVPAKLRRRVEEELQQ